MENNDNKNELFGEAISQLIHDIRNPLNIIIGFSSIIQIDETINDDIRNYIKKIIYSGMNIERMLTNIDFYYTDKIEIEGSPINLPETFENFFETKIDILQETVFTYTIESEKIVINYSLDILDKFFENLFLFTLKGFKKNFEKAIYVRFIVENNILKIIYADTSASEKISKRYFDKNEILLCKRGLGLLFNSKITEYMKGNIIYLVDDEWKSEIKKYKINDKYKHGFIIELPLNKN